MTTAGEVANRAAATVASEGAQPTRWATAAEGTRTTAKWMIGSLAASAALIFGAGPIVSRPALSWSADTTQLAVAVLSGTVGIVALILLVGVIADVLTPVKVTLSDIPKDMRSEIDAAAAVRLPSGSKSYAQFLKEFRRYRMMAAKLSGDQSALQRAVGSAPTAQDQLRLQQITQLLEDVQHNLDLYSSHAESYLDQAEYYGIAGLFARNRKKALSLAVVAALGALTFQLSLASAPADANNQTKPKLAYLVSSPDKTRLWRDLNLDSCVIGGKVPVLVSSGVGSEDSPYRLMLIAVSPTCMPKSFSAMAIDVTVEELPSTDVTINYGP